LAVHAGGVVGLYFAVDFAFIHDSSPTGLANAAFAITASLAALSFSYARNLESQKELQEQTVIGGERLLRGAILMILASLLQYADLSAQAPRGSDEPQLTARLGWLRAVVPHVLHPVAVVLFLLAVSSIYFGLWSLAAVLRSRARAPAEPTATPPSSSK
jgi:hypothetical protein